MGDLPKWRNGLIVMGDLPKIGKRKSGRVVIGDLPKWRNGRIVMGDLPKKKNMENGRVVMGDLPKNGKKEEWSCCNGWPTQVEEWSHCNGWPTQIKKTWRMVEL